MFQGTEFANAIKRSHPSSWVNNVKIATHVAYLVERFSEPNVAQAHTNRQEFGDYIEYLAVVAGPNAFTVAIREYLEKGLSATIAAVVALRAARSIEDFALAVTLLRQIHESSNGDIYVGHLLADSLAALNRLDELDDLTRLSLEKMRAHPNELVVSRWARLLVSMLRLEVAEEVINLLSVDNRARGTLHARLNSYKNAGRPLSAHMQTVVINLRNETRKFDLASHLLVKAGHNVQRMDAVEGARLPETVLKKLCGDARVWAQMTPGSVAASLSHFKVWEEFLVTGEPMCLVVEDDAGPFVHSSFLAADASNLERNHFTFVNERMSSAISESFSGNESGYFSAWQQTELWPAGRSGWGFDGYVLSREGAERSLEIAEKLGIRGHVDGQFGAYATMPDSDPINGIQRSIVQFRSELPQELSMSGACSRTPTIQANTFGVSSTVTAGTR